MRRSFSLFLSLLLLINVQFAGAQTAGKFNHNIDPNVAWAYDAGPDINDPMGKELIDLVAAYPFMPQVSEELLANQKFRIHFGPTYWRTRHNKNAAKILFIGQDATHIAEAAKRTATAGFGGRAQDLAAYFGVDESASFMNAYQNTIRGQYGAFNTPYIVTGRDGKASVRIGGYVDPGLWLMTQDERSPLVQWRNKYIDWFLRQNRSMKLIVLFGGAARDAMGVFIESKGGSVGTYFDEKDMANILVPEIKEKFAGGNNTYPAVLTETGKDLAEELLGRRIDYKNLEDQTAVQNAFKANPDAVLAKAAFSRGGPYANGMIHPGQLGGYKIDQISINGVKTISLKGLKLSDGSTVGDVLVAQFPHPSALSRMTNDVASKTMQKTLLALKPYVDRGWSIEADPGMKNKFAQGLPYEYSRSQIGPEYYDFGTPGTRMLAVSLASRMSGRPDVIVFGTRDRASFDMKLIDAAATATPGEKVDAGNVFATQARVPSERAAFDPGPGEYYAKLMKQNLDLKKIFASKSVKSHEDLADFGHYRGTFNNPKVIIVADPHGYDDLNTARALTGSRGQYLQSIMNSINIREQYLVFKTLPFGMDGATEAEWTAALANTKAYRENILSSLLKDNTPDLIIADGKYASAEVARIVKNQNIPVVNIHRETEADADGLAKAAQDIAKISKFKSAKFSGEWSNIPREHLPYGTRVWEGTSGDRVFNATGKFKGLAFAIVVPQWAYNQNVPLALKTKQSVNQIIDYMETAGLPLPGESMSRFFARKKAGGADNQLVNRNLRKAN